MVKYNDNKVEFIRHDELSIKKSADNTNRNISDNAEDFLVDLIERSEKYSINTNDYYLVVDGIAYFKKCSNYFYCHYDMVWDMFINYYNLNIEMCHSLVKKVLKENDISNVKHISVNKFSM